MIRQTFDIKAAHQRTHSASDFELEPYTTDRDPQS